jgi:hypothetical protein
MRDELEVTVNKEEEEDFDLILAQLEEQAASEALARKLQDEWSGAASMGPRLSLRRRRGYGQKISGMET